MVTIAIMMMLVVNGDNDNDGDSNNDGNDNNDDYNDDEDDNDRQISSVFSNRKVRTCRWRVRITVETRDPRS